MPLQNRTNWRILVDLHVLSTDGRPIHGQAGMPAMRSSDLIAILGRIKRAGDRIRSDELVSEFTGTTRSRPKALINYLEGKEFISRVTVAQTPVYVLLRDGERAVALTHALQVGLTPTPTVSGM
jgi:hypothetical protein